MNDVVIASAARTAIGSYGKSLAGVPPSDLGAAAGVAALARAGIDPDQVEHVVFGNVIHTESADMYMARVVGMKAGIPKEVPAYTVNRLCGTGVQAIVSATQAIQTGEADIALAGGGGAGSRPLRRGDRSRRGQAQEGQGAVRSRRAHPPGRLGRVDGEAEARVQA